jgi:hypothetical protein
MKLIDENMQTGLAPGNFGFSGIRPEKLGATEYTLVTLVGDKTGSLTGFEKALLEAKRAIVAACQKSPRAENLMVRVTEFNTSIDEVHGFAPLASIDPSLYVAPYCSGQTALYDATYSAVAATNEYAKMLAANEFFVNGIVFVNTDGCESPGASVQTVRSIKGEIARGVQNEWLESLIVILIGVNASSYKAQLEKFQTDAGLTQYIDIGDVTPESLARLADFVSRSISSQSQSLGTGGPSQTLSF